MIVYATVNGKYIPVPESVAKTPEERRGFYVNITNECTCACTFCLRPLKNMARESSLWLEKEPSEDEIWSELSGIPWRLASEIVFCGFGEPTMRLDALTNLLRKIKDSHPDVKTRVNTNGLSDLYYGRDTAPDFEGIADTLSISLNASNSERYLALTRSRFGAESFDAMLNFAVRAKKFVPEVVMTVVDRVDDDDEIARCRELCDARKLKLRVRTYEGN